MAENRSPAGPTRGLRPDDPCEVRASDETRAMLRLAVLASEVDERARREGDAVGVELGRIVRDDLDRRATSIIDAGCSGADDRVLCAVERVWGRARHVDAPEPTASRRRARTVLVAVGLAGVLSGALTVDPAQGTTVGGVAAHPAVVRRATADPGVRRPPVVPELRVGLFVCGRPPAPLLPGAPRRRWCLAKARAAGAGVIVLVNGVRRSVAARPRVVTIPAIGPVHGAMVRTEAARTGQLGVVWRLDECLRPGRHRIVAHAIAGPRRSTAAWVLRGHLPRV